VVETAKEWHARVCPLDAVTHNSWERTEARSLSAVWVVQGIVEMVPRHCPLPYFIRPLGAVDKATDPWWGQILDALARISNEFPDAWGVWYSPLSRPPCDIMLAESLEDTYHLSAFAGGTVPSSVQSQAFHTMAIR
jgi:hypothetical protein